MANQHTTGEQVFRSKTQLLLRDAWRKAFARALEGKTLQIVFQTQNQAHKARMDLYKAVQPEKHGKGSDVKLIEAAQTIEIVLHPEHRNILIMRDRGQGAIYSALEQAVGEKLSEVVDPDLMLGSEESLRQLEQLGVSPSEDSPEKKNPFYKDRYK